MKHAVMAVAAAVLLAAGSGCANSCMTGKCDAGCAAGGGCGPLGGVAHHRAYGGSGDPSAQVAYPYYTVRGPRDFFLDNPATIGP